MKKGIQLLLITGLILISQVGWTQSSSSAEGLTINENGNVGIGTNNPSRRLQIDIDNHGLGLDAVTSMPEIGGMFTSKGSNSYPFNVYGNLMIKTRSDYGGYYKIGFYTAASNDTPVERMTISPNGNVGIGTNNPSEALDVSGNITLGKENKAGQLNLRRPSDGNPAGFFGFHNSSNANELSIRNTSGSSYITFHTNAGGGVGTQEKMRIDKDGNVGIGDMTPDAALDVIGSIHYTGSISDVSDARIKENITPIKGALDIVQNINGVYFTMKGAPEKSETGFIAQNVQTYLPSAVNIIEEDTGYLGVSYSDLIPVAFEAIKEQQQQIERLRQKNEELTQENRQLRHRLEIIEEKLNVSSK